MVLCGDPGGGGAAAAEKEGLKCKCTFPATAFYFFSSPLRISILNIIALCVYDSFEFAPIFGTQNVIFLGQILASCFFAATNRETEGGLWIEFRRFPGVF